MKPLFSCYYTRWWFCNAKYYCAQWVEKCNYMVTCTSWSHCLLSISRWFYLYDTTCHQEQVHLLRPILRRTQKAQHSYNSPLVIHRVFYPGLCRWLVGVLVVRHSSDPLLFSPRIASTMNEGKEQMMMWCPLWGGNWHCDPGSSPFILDIV